MNRGEPIERPAGGHDKEDLTIQEKQDMQKDSDEFQQRIVNDEYCKELKDKS